MTRTGILGGTFDPIHVGHLDVAHAAQRALGLERVLLMPANVPPHRPPPHASAPHRFAMAALAAAGDPGLAVFDLEMLSDEPSFTSSTLERLSARGMDTRDIYLITGADAFKDIASWKDYPALLDRCDFAVVSRPACAVSSLPGLLSTLANRMVSPGAAEGRDRRSIVLIDAPTAPVSSTEVRRRLAAGEPVSGMVPDAVAEHIRKHGLYTQGSPLSPPTHGKN